MRTVLLTGATGAIGSVLAKYLLAEEGTCVRLLLRARSRDHLDQRLRELCAFWGVDPVKSGVLARVETVAGDVTLPHLGLDPSIHQRLSKEVTHVIHSAGDVNLGRPLEEARRSAVGSASHVVSFVDACRENGQFEKLEFLSTVSVAGNMPGTVPERAFTAPRAFRNSYEAAKAEAETFLLQKMHEGLPATIHRPSMVVGDSTSGQIIQFQVFYYLCEFLSGRRTAGIVPDARGIQLDIIPVDYVARAIQVSSTRSDAAGRIFHLCAGPAQAPRIDDLSRHLREFFVSHGKRVPRFRPVTAAWIKTLLPLARWAAPGKLRRSLESLPYFLAYLDAPQTFANVRSQEFFSAAGLDVPPVDSYLEVVLSYYLSRKAGSGDSVAGHTSRALA